jgi:hypothetical protein
MRTGWLDALYPLHYAEHSPWLAQPIRPKN